MFGLFTNVRALLPRSKMGRVVTKFLHFWFNARPEYEFHGTHCRGVVTDVLLSKNVYTNR